MNSTTNSFLTKQQALAVLMNSGAAPRAANGSIQKNWFKLAATQIVNITKKKPDYIKQVLQSPKQAFTNGIVQYIDEEWIPQYGRIENNTLHLLRVDNSGFGTEIDKQDISD